MNAKSLKRFTLRPSHYVAFMQLDSYASTGNFDVYKLKNVQSVAGAVENKTLAYYLASLYLQLGEDVQAYELLVRFTKASVEMKCYFNVLAFSQCKQLPMPRLTNTELDCIDYLKQVMNPANQSMIDVINLFGSFSIVGNAPAENAASPIASSCKFYFNDYRKNSRVTDVATVHVVTPSWSMDPSDQSEYLCITGNNIFSRRSNVWRKFVKNQRYKAVYTLPRQLWSELSVELASSPSAGLLILSYVARGMVAGQFPSPITGYVAGFSSGQSALNHSYDSVPLSERHNWPAEAIVYQRDLDQLASACEHFLSEA